VRGRLRKQVIVEQGNGMKTDVMPSAIQRQQYEFIDCRELAVRWSLPESWVRDQVRSRAADPLPHVRFGKYVRFRWGSPELESWAERRIVSGDNRTVGRVLDKENR
jgi:hypothetical protein